ncbi:hypothetical protein OH768_44210 [Streptomyces sp. NBC_01622]|uniref:hypothetical protein n=1 Tax=Streptomyces sp. NBC_01622 TaxID=2975903 RepID=UPI0038704E30|nr:hypothetical protein OH768_44210 [Streptomyces sp. NBC_01622]
MSDWVDLAVDGMRTRQAERAKAAEAKAAELDAEAAKEQTPEEKAEATRKARTEAEQERAEKIAARVQQGVRLRAAARRPMTEWERQVAGQALGEAWDSWDGPPPAA